MPEKTKRLQLFSNRLLNGESKSINSYNLVKEKASKLSKHLYKSGLELNPLLQLEKARIRNETTEKKANKIYSCLEAPQEDTSDLRFEHKPSDLPIQIINLPKQPFGSHKFPKDDHFARNHFMTKRDPNKSDELKQITKKFRLQEKRFKSQNPKNHSSTRSPERKYDVFDMEHGNLVCKRLPKILQAYESEKKKFMVDTTQADKILFKKFKLDEKEVHEFGNEKQKSSVFDRLYTPRKMDSSTLDSKLSKYLEVKYSRLLEDEKDNN